MAERLCFSDDELDERKTRRKTYAARPPPSFLGANWQTIHKQKHDSKSIPKESKQKQRNTPQTSDFETEDAEQVVDLLRSAASVLNQEADDERDGSAETDPAPQAASSLVIAKESTAPKTLHIPSPAKSSIDGTKPKTKRECDPTLLDRTTVEISETDHIMKLSTENHPMCLLTDQGAIDSIKIQANCPYTMDTKWWQNAVTGCVFADSTYAGVQARAINNAYTKFRDDLQQQVLAIEVPAWEDKYPEATKFYLEKDSGNYLYSMCPGGYNQSRELYRLREPPCLQVFVSDTQMGITDDDSSPSTPTNGTKKSSQTNTVPSPSTPISALARVTDQLVNVRGEMGAAMKQVKYNERIAHAPSKSKLPSCHLCQSNDHHTADCLQCSVCMGHGHAETDPTCPRYSANRETRQRYFPTPSVNRPAYETELQRSLDAVSRHQRSVDNSRPSSANHQNQQRRVSTPEPPQSGNNYAGSMRNNPQHNSRNTVPSSYRAPGSTRDSSSRNIGNTGQNRNRPQGRTSWDNSANRRGNQTPHTSPAQVNMTNIAQSSSQRNLLEESMINMNESLTEILKSQKETQLETTRALANLSRSQAERGADHIIEDIPKFSGNRDEFFDWLLTFETLVDLAGADARWVVLRKVEGPVLKCVQSFPPTTQWSVIKAELRRLFSHLPTTIHANVQLLERRQEAGETLQEYCYNFSLLALSATNKIPSQIVDYTKIIVFIRGLYNVTIRSKVGRKSHRNLQSCMDFAHKVDKDLLLVEGLNSTDRVFSISPAGNNSRNNRYKGAPVVPSQQNASSGPRPDGRAAMICYNCGVKGHSYRNCTLANNSTNQNTTAQSGPPTTVTQTLTASYQVPAYSFGNILKELAKSKTQQYQRNWQNRNKQQNDTKGVRTGERAPNTTPTASSTNPSNAKAAVQAIESKEKNDDFPLITFDDIDTDDLTEEVVQAILDFNPDRSFESDLEGENDQ